MILLILFTLLLAINLVIVYRLFWGFRHFIPSLSHARTLAEDEAPSVTVCIPARNERHAMADCLEAVVASDYPKLEIIVLDDGSRDDTSLLIKSFAHAGVRFVEGEPLPEGWLGKNHALDTLLGKASGQYVLFMDVDTRIQPQTVSQLMHYIVSQKVDMVSIMPLRHNSWRASVVFATMRFFWEIVGHKDSKPASVSTAWMIKRTTLSEELGGMAAYPTDTRPDSVIAKALAVHDKYRFLMSTEQMGVYYEKKWSSQLHTSVRLTFPALGSNWLRVILAVSGLALALLPYVCIVIVMWTENPLLLGYAWVLAVLQTGLYMLYLSKIWSRGWWIGGLALPVLLVMEIWIVIASAIGYLQKTITWKGRPIASTVVPSPTKQSENVT